jgi:hypothetical protein
MTFLVLTNISSGENILLFSGIDFTSLDLPSTVTIKALAIVYLSAPIEIARTSTFQTSDKFSHSLLTF